ncbi:MAG TPA: hypothetical protein VJ123_01315 [Anaerolineales bacterium]|nr:hypothetical protein [Anaerolineales bacterium]
MVAATFALFSLIFKWNIFGVRYHLPYFVLFASAFGRLWGTFERVKAGSIIAAFLLVGSRPWLFSIDSRPLIPKPGRSLVGSVLVEPRERLYFANLAATSYAPLQRITSEILDRGCSEVGIMLLGDAPECWPGELMSAPRPDSPMMSTPAGAPTATPRRIFDRAL